MSLSAEKHNERQSSSDTNRRKRRNLNTTTTHQNQQRGRNRVCKQCKFSSTDAKLFYQHQVTAHGGEEEEEGEEKRGEESGGGGKEEEEEVVGEEGDLVDTSLQCHKCKELLDSKQALETHLNQNQCNASGIDRHASEQKTFNSTNKNIQELSEIKEDTADPLSALYNSDTETSAVEEDGMTSPVANMQLSNSQNGEDVSNNNNEIRAKSAFFENNPDYPGTTTKQPSNSAHGVTSPSNLSPNDSGYVHDRESNASVGQDFDEDRVGDNRLDTSDDNPGLVIDEGAGSNPDLASPIATTTAAAAMNNLYQTPYINITPESAQESFRDLTNSFSSPRGGNTANTSSQSLLKRDLFSPQNAVFPGLLSMATTTAIKSPTKPAQYSAAQSMNSIATPQPAKRCAPVREAVDPAKYITVQEGDGVKYACSKCGNVYKWRKSLNKHWKEKHDGEIPEPRTGGANNIPLPRIGANSYLGNGRPSNQHVSPRQPANQRNVPTTRNEAPYLTSLAMNPSSYRLPSQFDSTKTSENPFAALRAPGLKSSPSPKNRATGLPYYRSPNTKKTSLGNSDVMKYLTSQQQYLSSILPSQHGNKSTFSPPLAHAAKALNKSFTLGRSAVNSEAPMDLTDLSGTRASTSTEPSYDQHGALDLSMKPTAKKHPANLSSPNFVQPKATHKPEASIQDEPLDFSKSTDVDTKRSGPTTLWNVPKVDSTFSPKKVASMISPAGKEMAFQMRQCPTCSYVSRDDFDLEKHMQLHIAQEITCYECKESFQTVEDLNQHFVLRHMQVLARRMAQVRSEKTSGATTREEGELNKDGDQLYQYLTKNANKSALNCVVCGAKYQFQWALLRHFDQEHSSLPNPYQIPDSPSPEATPVIIPQQVTPQAAMMVSPANIESNVSATAEKTYKCSHCPFSALTSSALTRHQIRHSLNKHHVCKMCGYTAKVKDELMEHYAEEHPHVQPSELKSSTGTVMLGVDSDDSQEASTRIIGPDGKSIIDLGCETEGTAIVFPQAPEETGRGKPASSVQVLLPYKCSVCEYRARWPSEITQHMKNHSDEKPFRCPRCTYKSKWKWDVVKHLKRCGGGTVKDVIDITKLGHIPSPSGICSPDNTLTVSHARELSRGPPNAIVLPSNEPGALSFGLDLHGNAEKSMDENSEDGVKFDATTLECSECSYVGQSVGDMRKHVKFHTYDVQQVYCSHCPFVGNNPAELRRHLRVHSDEKPYVCRSCGYSSKWKCDLKKHCRTYQHIPTVPLTYGGHGRKPSVNGAEGGDNSDQMPSDDQMGTSQDEYDSTDAENSSAMAHDNYSNVEELKCEKCPFTTADEKLLASHALIHNTIADENPFKCRNCTFECNDLTTFLQHKQIHVMNENEEEMHEEKDEETAHIELGVNRRKQSKQSIMKNKFELQGKLHENVMNINGTSASSAITNPTDLSGNNSTSELQTYTTNTHTLSCGHCSFATNFYQDYERHLATHTRNETRYTCEWCPWNTDQLYMLYRHTQVVHPLMLNTTDKDAFLERAKKRAMSTKESSSRWPHSPYNRSPSISPAQSPVTGKPLYSEGKKTKRRLKTCGKCGYITDNVTTLQRHMAKHGKHGKYTCTHCDYSVDKQHVLDYHIRLVHYAKLDQSPVQSPAASPVEADNASNGSTVDPNEGEEEGQQIGVNPKADNADVTMLGNQNFKVVHISNRTVYNCTKCPYNTMKYSSITNHARQHGSNKKFTCTSCDYSVDHVSHLRAHTKSVHGDNGGNPLNAASPVQNGDPEMNGTDPEFDGNELDVEENGLDPVPNAKRMRLNSENESSPFACSNCSFEGSNMSDLVAHKCDGQPQQLYCEHCEYTSTSENLMKLHAKIHTINLTKPVHPAKIYLCDKCPYYTPSRSQSEAHKSKHGLKSKVDCPFCDYSCGNTTQQGNHIKLHFPDQDIERDVLHGIMRGEPLPEGFVPQLKHAAGTGNGNLDPESQGNDLEQPSADK